MKFDRVELYVNERKVPLNRFLKKLLGRILYSFATSLKGIEEEEIKLIKVELASKENEEE